MAQISLSYTARSNGQQTVDQIVAKLGAIPIGNQGELDLLGMVKIDDSTADVSGEAVRTIVLETTSDGDELWGSDELLAKATVNLYTIQLAQGLPGRVLAAAPVVTS